MNTPYILFFILIVMTAGCSQNQNDNARSVAYIREEPKDDLLKIYDQLILERQKQLDRYTKEIQSHPDSSDLLYQRALTKLEMLNLQKGLSECWHAKNSGHRPKKEFSSLYDILRDRSDKKPGEEIKDKIIQHENCYKVAESGDLVNAYQVRVMSTSYEDIHAPIRDLSKAIQLNTNLAQVYFYRAEYSEWQSQQNDQDRLEDYSTALNLKPDAEIFLKRALLRHNHFRSETLVYRDCENALRVNPAYADAYVLKALVAWHNSACGNIDSYKERRICERKIADTILHDLKKALSFDPDFPLLKEDINRYQDQLTKDNPEDWGFSSENY